MKNNYLKMTHFYGRISCWIILVAFLSTPFLTCLIVGTTIDWEGFLTGFIATAPLYYAVAIVEMITYIPMLGAGGTYISFVTGNISNLKLPASINALDQFGVDIKSEEGEVVSTIATTVSSLTNTVVIIIGLALVLPFGEQLNNSAILSPAFNNIIPALFGALAVVFISKNWKIAIAPCALMLILFVTIPALNEGTVGIMVPVAVVFTLIVSRILYKKGKLD